MDITFLKPFLNWLHLHPEWGVAFAFFISFAESIAIIGLIVPGSIIMSAIGLLIGSGVLPWGSTFVAGIIGAYCGDLISFWFGYHYREKICAMWPFRLAPKLIIKGEYFFKLHGGKSVLIGRFLGAVRPVIPIIAGMLKMPISRFMLTDLLAATLWAPAYMLPGILIGAASLALPPEFAKKMLVYMVIGLIAVGLTFWFIKKILSWTAQQINQLFKTLWLFMRHQKRFEFLVNLIERKHHVLDQTQLILLVIWLICLILFCCLTLSVIYSSGLYALNQSIYHLLRTLYSPTLQPILIGITFLGNKLILLAFWSALLIWFLLRRDTLTALHWLILGCFSMGITGILKRLIVSPRPSGLAYGLLGFSYPSAHTTLSIVLLGFFVFLINQSLSRFRYLRIVNYCLLFIVLLLIAFSRLYLNAHWMSDVIGGVFLAFTLLLPVIISYRRQFVVNSHPVWMTIIGLSTLLLAWGIYIYYDYAKAKVDYTPRWQIDMTSGHAWWQHGLLNAPIVRKNLLHKPVQTFNVEYLGNLNHLKQALIKANWQEKPKTALLTTINYLGQKDKKNLMPLFNPVYLDRYPVLVMAKFIADENKLLILRLWDSHTYIYETEKNIWVGALSFYQPSNENVFTYLIPDLVLFELFEWKKLFYPHIKRLNKREDASWHQQVLLIKTKS